VTVTIVGDDGTVTITDAALHQIVAQAVETVDGVRLRRRHTEIAIEPTGARVQLELAIAYGRVLPEIARAVQEQVASALGTMCGVTVTSVDVSVEELD
jgi:uncharacterized alkaline shock family protein YloU